MAKTDKAHDKDNIYFLLVPRVNQKVPNHDVLVSQDREKIEEGVQTQGASTDVMSHDSTGLFTTPKNHPNIKRRLAAMEVFKKNNNHEGQIPVVIGPFETQSDAFDKMHELREKTPEEVAGAATERSEELEAENAELKAKLAAAQKK